MSEAKRQKPLPDEGEVEEPPLHEREPEKYVSAHAAIRLRFLGSAEEAAGSEEGHSPEFVHQLFETEAIAVPPAERPLKIEVMYAADSLDLFLQLANNAPMTGAAEDAAHALAAKLPQMCSTREDFMQQVAAPFNPASLGADKVSEYTVGSATFDVYVGPLVACPEFAERLMSVMRWCIEGFSPIDLEEDRWRLITVFERLPEGRCKLVAAGTLFRFQRFPGPQLIVKVCQVCVLPSYQRRGHGSKLLQAIYEYATTDGAEEVTVEDPNPQFRLLRDLTDLRNCVRRELMRPAQGGLSAKPAAEKLDEARGVLKITTEQLTRCYEAQQYAMLQRQLGAVAGAEREALVKPYRLDVKRRLNKKHKEELDALMASELPPEGAAAEGNGSAAASVSAVTGEPAAARKKRLEELYCDAEAQYKSLCDRCGL